MKEKYQISFSGGRTSAYMTKLLLDKYKDHYDFIVTFANTGMEHINTLKFVNNCDKYFGFNTVWLEADVQHGERRGTLFRQVTFETASRNCEPFEEVIKKYGIPNPSYLHCTRELKLAPMRAYLKSLGIDHKSIKTAIGIRKDELRRVSKQQEENNITYPLISEFPSDKQDVLDWWEDQEFDLDLNEEDGNCRGCFKKSFKKIFLQLDKDPTLLTFHTRMEEMYPEVGNSIKGLKRVFFRGNTSAHQLLTNYKDLKTQHNPSQGLINMYENSGCSESCEVYSTD